MMGLMLVGMFFNILSNEKKEEQKNEQEINK